MFASFRSRHRKTVRPRTNSRRLLGESLENRLLLAGEIIIDFPPAPPTVHQVPSNEVVDLDFSFSSEFAPNQLGFSWALYDNAGNPYVLDRNNMTGVIEEQLIDSLAGFLDVTPGEGTDVDEELPGFEQYDGYSVKLTVPASSLISLYDTEINAPLPDRLFLLLRIEVINGEPWDFVEFETAVEFLNAPSLIAEIDSVDGPLVVGAPLTVNGTTSALVEGAAWNIYFDANDDSLFDPSEIVDVIPADYVDINNVSTLLPLSYTPVNAGGYRVELAVATVDASASDSVDLEVTSSAVSNGVLYAGASAGGSAIFIGPTSGGVQVNVDGDSVTYAEAITQVVVHGGAGNDWVVIGNVGVSAWVFGGDGNDVIAGGGGDDVLLGGNGSDTLIGNGGRDLLIGGHGGDLIVGNAGDDILIAGYTTVDNDAVALAAIMNLWTSNSLSFAARTDALRLGHLVNEVNVFDDDAMDLLAGMSGLDWYFANLVRDDEPFRNRDFTLGMNAQELAQYEELIDEPLP